MPMFYIGQLDAIAKLNLLANGLFAVSIETANFAGVVGNWHALKTNGLTCTLPAVPLPTDRVRFASMLDSVTTLTINPNGQNIDSAAGSRLFGDTPLALNFELLYVDATIGWRVVAVPVSLTTVILPIHAERAVRRARQLTFA